MGAIQARPLNRDVEFAFSRIFKDWGELQKSLPAWILRET